jgi:hypothetical protein
LKAVRFLLLSLPFTNTVAFLLTTCLLGGSLKLLLPKPLLRKSLTLLPLLRKSCTLRLPSTLFLGQAAL